MKTILNHIPFTGPEYDSENDTASYYLEGRLFATLDFPKNDFQETDWSIEAESSQKELDYYYEQMIKCKERHDYGY